VQVLSREFNVSGYFYNPNIQPYPEYSRRLQETERLMRTMGVTLYESEYDGETWTSLTKGMEAEPEQGKRCIVCYRMRLEKTASFAKEKGISDFTTTLTISPHKNSATILDIGRDMASRYGLRFLEIDFKKDDGFRRSVNLCHHFGLYRQDYCGCIHSLAGRLDVKTKELVKLNQEMRDCRRCDFLTGERILPAGGVRSDVMLIGQAPGKRELLTRQPFSGPAGSRLFEWFTRIGIPEEDLRGTAYITAVVKCYPGHLPGRKLDRPPSPPQIRNCACFIEREIRIVRPRLLIPIGSLAVRQTIGRRKLVETIGNRFRAQVFGHLCTVVPLPHPSGANPWVFKHPECLDRALLLLKDELRNG
jgi:uracil-DNA glycosylase family 4